MGFCNGASSAAQALLVANTPPGRIGSALSRLQTGMLVGQTLGPAVATMAVAVVSRSHWLFWFSGSLLLVISLHRDRPRAFLRRAHRPGARPAYFTLTVVLTFLSVLAWLRSSRRMTPS